VVPPIFDVTIFFYWVPCDVVHNLVFWIPWFRNWKKKEICVLFWKKKGYCLGWNL